MTASAEALLADFALVAPVHPEPEAEPGIGSAAPALEAVRRPGSEAETVRLAREGDHEAFRILVERYQSRAFRLALRVLRDEDQAADAVQDALIRAYTALPRFEGRSSFYTWLYRLVLNQCLDRKRRERLIRIVDWEDGDPLESAAAAPPCPEVSGVLFAPAAQLRRKELRQAIGAALEKMSPKAAQVLLLREVDGLSYAEIAEAEDIPLGTVMSRLHYARRRLQEILKQADVRDD